MRLTASAVGLVRSHADTLARLPAGPFHSSQRVRDNGVDEPRPYVAVDPNEIEKLVARGVVDRVTRETGHCRCYNIYRVPADVRERAQEIVERRDSPVGCGHSGIRNLGDGWYTCTSDNCDVRVRREEVEL